jgi:hypothetical protein
MAAHAYNSITLEAEAGQLGVHNQLGYLEKHHLNNK